MTQKIKHDNEKTPWTAYNSLFVGAVAIHPICFIGVFLIGFAFGASEPVISATSQGSNFSYLFTGGGYAISNLLLIYIFTVGIAPLMISIAGTMIGLVSYFSVVILQAVGNQNRNTP